MYVFKIMLNENVLIKILPLDTYKIHFDDVCRAMLSKFLKVGVLGCSLVALKHRRDQNDSNSKFNLSRFRVSAEEAKFPDHPNTKECILVIGTTGTGKSATISKMTGEAGAAVEVSGRAESVTRQCEVVPQPDTRLVWVDTVGYDDTGGGDDEATFRSILQFIQGEQLTRVRAVVWTVLPQERRDARLQRQADFINRFREERIWSNVILVVKQPGPGGSSLLRASQGPVEAARRFSEDGIDSQRILGFTYLDDNVPQDFRTVLDNIDADKRQAMLYLTVDEVIDKIQEAVESISDPVQVIFEDVRCEDCGIVGDRRLLPDFCHMEKMYTHPQPLSHFHPAELESYHPLPEEPHHPGVLRLTGGPNETCETVKTALLALTPVVGLLRDTGEGVRTGVLAAAAHLTCARLHTPLGFTYGCCGGDEAEAGCRVAHPCCRRPPASKG